MCLICVEFQKQRMTIGEARRAMREMSSTMPQEHVVEVNEMLREAELEALKDRKAGVQSSDDAD